MPISKPTLIEIHHQVKMQKQNLSHEWDDVSIYIKGPEHMMYFKGRSKLSIHHEQESYYSEGAYPDPLKWMRKKRWYKNSHSVF